MVSKSLIIIAFLLCAILDFNNAVDSSIFEDEEDYESSGSEGDEDDVVYPSLSCLIFEDIGCNSQCVVISDAFGTKSTGICNDENFCECNVENENSFDDEDAGKFIKNGKPNFTAIKKHVSDKLPKTLKSADIKDLSVLKYRPILLDILKEAENDSEAFDQLALDIRRTKNKSLGDVLSQYLKKNKLKEPMENIQNQLSVADIMAYYVVDELVKKVDGKNSIKRVNTSARRPATKKGKTSPEKVVNYERISPSMEASKTPANKTGNPSSMKDRFTLEDFDQSQLKGYGLLNKNWKGAGYKVSYQRSRKGDINLNWTKGQDQVSIQWYATKDVNQTWNFQNENVSVTISKTADGDINESWNFGMVKYQFSKSGGKFPNANWSSGKSSDNTRMLRQYHRYIDSWCEANNFLIIREYCVIYNKI
ncbi:uncharacterized protein LOC135845019 [Planococcus citri]|uniref:uncharacterized protein LOC135845019 n=1 Tax=Planococcus citri TaxID=170843 RepID=UPI0031F92ACF